MIKEISLFSGGAQVKLLSNKEKKTFHNENIALITGVPNTKAEAAALITEKIAAFRYAAKVLYRIK